MFLRPSLSYFCIFSEGFSRGFMLQCSRHTILIILIQCLRKNKKKCSRNRMSHKCWKQILQESLSKPFLIIIFTHFETLLLVIVFTLIVQLSVIIREYPNVLNLFLTSKSIFFVVWEWFIYKYWVLIAKCKIFSAFFFQLIFVSKRASRDGLSLNSTIMSLFFVLCDTSILDFFISVDVMWHRLYTISMQLSSCATGIPEISSISPHPYCSSWFLLTFSSFMLFCSSRNVVYYV